MTWFDACFDKLIGHEGGYTEGKNDPGGETNWGISKRSYPHLNIKALTLDDAKAIYYRDFWQRAQCDKLPPNIAYLLFDCAVNSGIGQAIRFLQRAVNVADDGALGPITLRAVGMIDIESLSARYLGQRLEFMTKLTTWDYFGKGWSRRIADQLKGV